jgi:type II secretory pathway pseudopilin PulG
MKRGTSFLPRRIKKTRGQVWVETVIYTLIALVMIGLVLTFVKPKISELQDKAVLQQSMSILDNINGVIQSLSEGGPGNKRKIDLTLKAGSITINSENNSIVFSMDSHYQPSEYDQPVSYGDLILYTHQANDLNLVNVTLYYGDSYNLTYNGQKIMKTLTASSTPYALYISNKGGIVPNMDFEL